MKKTIRLTESELTTLIKRLIGESSSQESANMLKQEVESVKNKRVQQHQSIQYCAIYLFHTGDLSQDESDYLIESCTSQAWGLSCTKAFASLDVFQLATLNSCILSCVATGKHEGTVCKPDNARCC